ncbi:MAG TPA: 4a-hydroxytetrahydrobiopterin dehydratase [Micavibrio sp.]|nr:4a-hydroxytetrahydrobiopterin dehydratase [Micavibrio sp.]
MTEKMIDADVKEALADMEGWTFVEGRPAITKKFKFKDFVTAWNFMDDVAGYADEISHHPEWTNIYNRVEITLSTHDAGGLTELDFDLAEFIDEAAKSYA